MHTILGLLLGVLIVFQAGSATALARTEVSNNQVRLHFPETATFSARLSAGAQIRSVTLEYGNQQQTCGEVIAKAFPNFEPSTSVDVEWTWDMRQSGSLPPGASLWWRWHYTDEAGQEYSSETQTVIWLDNIHDWQTMSSGGLNLHWYGNDASVARTLLDAGLEGLRRNQQQAGLVTDGPVDIYVYSDYEDMRAAILYEPAWTGGMAYSDHNIVIMGLAYSDPDWDRDTVIHELTHVLVGHFTFSCLGTVPAWLNEGLAMLSEGELDGGLQSQFGQAIREDALLSVRSLNGGFSELPDKANLSYGESYSITKFLIDEYGQEKMTELLSALRDAKPVDQALLDIYGFDTDGLEDAWRQAIGARPRTTSAQPTARPTPTRVPTYVPIAGAPLVVTPTAYVIPTSSFEETALPARKPPAVLTFTLLALCCVLLMLIGVIVLGFFVRNQRKRGGTDV